MEKQLTIFDERIILGKEFRMYGDIENPLFLAKEVAEWIDYAYKDKKKGTRNINMMLQSIDEDEKIKATLGGNNLATQNSHGGLRSNTEMWFVTEDGLYEVLMQSRKPIAKQFKKEVKRLLKQMRLTGGVVIEGREEEFVRKYFPSFSDEVKHAMALDLYEKNKQYRAKLEEQQPHVDLSKKRLSKNGTYTITDVTKTLGLKKGQITGWAKENGYIHKTIIEVNNKGEEYFKVVCTDGEHKGIGVTEKGLNFINDNIEEIKTFSKKKDN